MAVGVQVGGVLRDLLHLSTPLVHHDVKPQKDIYRSKVLKGFWLRLEWLWPDTRPLKTEALAEILRSKK